MHAANAAQRASLARYQETVLEAFLQVSDVMQALANNQDLVAIQQRAVDTANANVRNTRFGAPLPASTLIVVSGVARPEFFVEIEAVAAGPA